VREAQTPPPPQLSLSTLLVQNSETTEGRECFSPPSRQDWGLPLIGPHLVLPDPPQCGVLEYLGASTLPLAATRNRPSSSSEHSPALAQLGTCQVAPESPPISKCGL
jgi:hypothetical protein